MSGVAGGASGPNREASMPTGSLMLGQLMWCDFSNARPGRPDAPVLTRAAADTRFLGVRFAGIDIWEDPAARARTRIPRS